MISWGVSFASVSLVAGMTTFLGLSDGGGQTRQAQNQQQEANTAETPSQGQGSFFGHRGHRDRNNQSSQFDGESSDSQFSSSGSDDGNQFGNGDLQFPSDNSQQFDQGNGQDNEQFDTKTGGTNF